MEVFFEDYNTGLCKPIGQCSNENQAIGIMNKYLQRYDTINQVSKVGLRNSTNEIVYSFGSKTQYFIIKT